MKIKKITFQGWKNCIELTNGDFRIVVTTEIGPRIVGAFLGPKGENLLYLDKKLLGTSNQKVWTNYGGHPLEAVLVLRPRSRDGECELTSLMRRVSGLRIRMTRGCRLQEK